MKLTTAIQEALLAILCYDDTPGGAKMVAGMIPVNTYDPYYRDIARDAVDFINKYDAPPGEHTLDIIDALKARTPEDAEVLDRIFMSIADTKATINRDYVMGKAKVFARHQSIKRGIANAIDALQMGTEEGVLQAESALASSTKTSYDLFDPGVDFFRDTARTLAFFNDESQAFPSGIPEIDAVGLGPARKKMFLFGGRPGVGKTWFAWNVIKHNIMVGNPCLLVSLEMGEEESCLRGVQTFFSVTKRKAQVIWKQFKRNAKGQMEGFEDVLVEGRLALSAGNARAQLANKIGRHRRRRLVVKEFPTGRLTVRELEAYLDGLEGSMGFIPAVVVVDYPDLMLLSDRNDHRIAVGQVYKELRGLAAARNFALVAPSQLNRESEGKRVAGKANLSDDDSKVATADILVTYNQTQDEKDCGLARLFVAKGRGDEDSFTILLSQAYAMGQFRMDSTRMHFAVSKQLEEFINAQGIGGQDESEDT